MIGPVMADTVAVFAAALDLAMAKAAAGGSFQPGPLETAIDPP